MKVLDRTFAEQKNTKSRMNAINSQVGSLKSSRTQERNGAVEKNWKLFSKELLKATFFQQKDKCFSLKISNTFYIPNPPYSRKKMIKYISLTLVNFAMENNKASLGGGMNQNDIILISNYFL